MSKASQRRLAEKQRRQRSPRGSPERIYRQLMEQCIHEDDPERFLRECIRLLPADPVTASTERLLSALNQDADLLERVAGRWEDVFNDMSENANEVLPGLLLQSPLFEYLPRYDVRPFSILGRIKTELDNAAEVLRVALEPGSEFGIWVFGTLGTIRGETVALAVHRDGTAVAQIRLGDKWIRRIPVYCVSRFAHETVAYLACEDSNELRGMLEAVQRANELDVDAAGADVLMREIADLVQTPYAKAMWRMAVCSVATSRATGHLENRFKEMAAVINRMRPPSHAEDQMEALREERDRLATRVKSLTDQMATLVAKAETRATPSPEVDDGKSVARRLACIF